MYCRNQYYQPYQARDKKKDKPAGHVEEGQDGRGQENQQEPLSTPTSSSTAKLTEQAFSHSENWNLPDNSALSLSRTDLLVPEPS